MNPRDFRTDPYTVTHEGADGWQRSQEAAERDQAQRDAAAQRADEGDDVVNLPPPAKARPIVRPPDRSKLTDHQLDAAIAGSEATAATHEERGNLAQARAAQARADRNRAILNARRAADQRGREVPSQHEPACTSKDDKHAAPIPPPAPAEEDDLEEARRRPMPRKEQPGATKEPLETLRKLIETHGLPTVLDRAWDAANAIRDARKHA